MSLDKQGEPFLFHFANIGVEIDWPGGVELVFIDYDGGGGFADGGGTLAEETSERSASDEQSVVTRRKIGLRFGFQANFRGEFVPYPASVFQGNAGWDILWYPDIERNVLLLPTK